MVPLTPLVKSLLNGEFLTPVNYRAQTTVCVLPTERVSLDLLLGYTGHGEQLSILTGLSITLWSLGHALEADLKVNLHLWLAAQIFQSVQTSGQQQQEWSY